MTLFFYVKVKVGKFLANVISAVVRNKEKRHALRERLDPLNPSRCVDYLGKHYTDEPPVEPFDSGSEEGARNYIWVCWLQGYDAAPVLVQNCIGSVRQHKPEGYEVVVITSQNYQQFVVLPEHIVQKWHKGLITNTHFSDLLRIFLLARHGGYWIDATCLLTSPIPAVVARSDLFLFRSHGEFAYTHIQSCFIRCQRNHYVMRKWCACMSAYWRRENSLIHYFTLHLMFRALMHNDPQFAQAAGAIPVMSDEPMHILLKAMLGGEHYSDGLIAKANDATFFQKLTYKFDPTLLNDPQTLAAVLSSNELTTQIFQICSISARQGTSYS
jgi:hypothetical protein